MPPWDELPDRELRFYIVATLEDVARITASLSEMTEGVRCSTSERHGNLTWFVGGQAVAWAGIDRPVWPTSQIW